MYFTLGYNKSTCIVLCLKPGNVIVFKIRSNDSFRKHFNNNISVFFVRFIFNRTKKIIFCSCVFKIYDDSYNNRHTEATVGLYYRRKTGVGT